MFHLSGAWQSLAPQLQGLGTADGGPAPCLAAVCPMPAAAICNPAWEGDGRPPAAPRQGPARLSFRSVACRAERATGEVLQARLLIPTGCTVSVHVPGLASS